jgi:hypothetical protein
MFQNMLASYQRSGLNAMKDSMAQAASLTGGYGNSWAQSVGQQAYNQYLQEAYNQLPAYYQLALDAYNLEGDELARRYSMLSEQDQLAYSRLMDELNIASGQYDRLYNESWNQYADKKDTAFNLASMENSEWWNNYQKEWNEKQFEYEKEWNQKQFEYQQEQDRIANARAAASAQRAAEEEEEVDYTSYVDAISKAREQYSDEEFANYLNSLSIPADVLPVVLALSSVPSNYLDEQMSYKDMKAEARNIINDKTLTARQQQNMMRDFLNKIKKSSYYDEILTYFKGNGYAG